MIDLSSIVAVSFIDFEGRFASLIPSRLRAGPRWEAILAAWGDELRELNDALYETVTDSSLDAASGDLLRRYALVVGEPPEGVSETDLKRLVRARIASNISDGGREALVRVWQALTTEESFVRDGYPASVFAQAVVPNLPGAVVASRSSVIMRRATAAAIGTDLVVGISGAFTFGDAVTGEGPEAFDVLPLALVL